MQEYYFYTIILPNKYNELFADYIIESTQEAIEEYTIEESMVAEKDFSLFNIDDFPINKNSFIVYSQNDPSTSLLPSLFEFASQTSQRLEENVGFAYKSKKEKNQDWIQKYKDSIVPIIYQNFYIHPSWYEGKKDFIDIVIDPALAFGSGHHSTTLMCIKLISSLSLNQKSILDVGCGSGILSIVAKKLGGKVSLCDTDCLAIEESKKNFALNKLTLDNVWQGSINDSNEKYDIIIANLMTDIIKILYKEFFDKLKSNSILVLSGILKEYKNDVLETFSDFKILDILEEDGWVALKLTQR